MILWFYADEQSRLIKDYIALGVKIKLFESKDELEDGKTSEKKETCSSYYSNGKRVSEKEIIIMVKEWLQSNTGWLLVYDNAKSHEALKAYLPSHGGDVLVTSINEEWENKVTFGGFTQEQSKSYVRKVTGLIDEDEEIDKLIGKKYLAHLPLALAQACYYIKNSDNIKTIKQYLKKFDDKQKELLSRREKFVDHEAVAITWNITVEEINRKSNASVKLLKFCSFMHPDNIIYELLNSYLSRIGILNEDEQQKVRNVLYQYSMITTNSDKNAISIHRLVQRVICLEIDKEEANKDILPLVIDILNSNCSYLRTNLEAIQKIIPHFRKLSEKTFLINKSAIEQVISTQELARMLYQFGIYYQDARLESDRAIKYLEKAKKIIEINKNIDILLKVKILRQLAKAYTLIKDIDKSRHEYNVLWGIWNMPESKSFSEVITNEFEKALIDYSHFLVGNKDYDAAIDILGKVIKDSKNPKNIAWCYHLLGNRYGSENNYLMEIINTKEDILSDMQEELKELEDEMEELEEWMTIKQERLEDLIDEKQAKIDDIEAEIADLNNEKYDCLEQAYNYYLKSIDIKITLHGENADLLKSANAAIKIFLQMESEKNIELLIKKIYDDVLSHIFKNNLNVDLIQEGRIILIQNMQDLYDKYNNAVIKNKNILQYFFSYFTHEMKFLQDKNHADNDLILKITETINTIRSSLAMRIKRTAPQSDTLSSKKKRAAKITTKLEVPLKRKSERRTDNLLKHDNDKASKPENVAQLTRQTSFTSDGKLIPAKKTKSVIEEKESLSRHQKVKEILDLMGIEENDVRQLGDISISRGEVSFNINDLDSYYTADVINILLYLLNQIQHIQTYPAIVPEQLNQYVEQINSQIKNYAFIPLNVAFDAKNIKHKNHWVALIIDKKHGLVFYIDPAKKTGVPKEVEELNKSISCKESIILNPIDFQEKEKQEGWVRHCGVYVVEILEAFAERVRNNQCVTGSELANTNIEKDSLSLQTILSSIPSGEAENVRQLREKHIEKIYAILISEWRDKPSAQQAQPKVSESNPKQIPKQLPERSQQNNNFTLFGNSKKDDKSSFLPKDKTVLFSREEIRENYEALEKNKKESELKKPEDTMPSSSPSIRKSGK